MNYLTFFQPLSQLDQDGDKSLQPFKSSGFPSRLIPGAGGRAAGNLGGLLNWAVACLEPGEAYCEVGCGQGERTIAALREHPDTIAYIVDDFATFDATDTGYDRLLHNLATAELESQVWVCNQPILEFLQDLGQSDDLEPIGIYLDNGTRDRESRLAALHQIVPLLADRAILILSCPWDEVHQAHGEFCQHHPPCQPWSTPLLFPGGERFEVLLWHGSPASLEASPLLPELPSLTLPPKEQVLESHFKETLALQMAGGDPATIEARYQHLLHWDHHHTQGWLHLGILYYTSQRYAEALLTLGRTVDLAPEEAKAHYHLGLVLTQMGDLSQAIYAYENALHHDPHYLAAYNNLGNLLSQVGKMEEAEQVYRQAIAAHPHQPGSYLNLGNLQMQQNQVEQAIASYQQALQLKPQDPDILYNLAVALETQGSQTQAHRYYAQAAYGQGNYREAIPHYQAVLEAETGDPALYLALATAYLGLDQGGAAIATYQTALQHHPTTAYLHFGLILALEQAGQTLGAIAAAETAAQQFQSPTFQLESQRILPILYDSPAEIATYRQRFSQGLERFVAQTRLDTPEAQGQALASISQRTNFYLQYQGQDDRPLQKLYGQFVHRVMAANCPQWTTPLTMPPRSPSGKIRVGYYSPHIRFHCGAKWALGWLRHHDPNQFEVYTYYSGRPVDQITAQFHLYSHHFRHIPEDLGRLCQQIREDDLHILVLTDIGIHPQTTQLAGLRLAPVQCTAWGHPITSGSPTIDYYLSSDLMEPAQAQAHYTETLVRLPNLGFSYIKPGVPNPTKSRADFGLKDHGVLYLSCQSLFKYLPQHDRVFPAIAQALPQAQFVFLSHSSSQITEQFRQRLHRAFAEAGLRSTDYCTILPRLTWVEFLHLNQVADVYLDTLDWSGGNTTLEAIACGLPVVTLPGEFMRGRHGYAFLQKLGMQETIAADLSDYVQKAGRLGGDRDYRQSVVERMAATQGDLFDDRACVIALEAFYQQVVERGQQG